MKHAKLSASGSHRWMACPGSVKAEEGYPNTSSSFANEGSCAHEVGEKALTMNSPAINYVGEEYFDTVVDAEMCDYVQKYIDYVRDLEEIGGETLVETRVDFSGYVPEGFGTADAIVINDDHIHVIDLKYGKGVPVYPDNNTQGMLYALGAMHDLEFMYDIEHITIHIVQPRLNNYSQWDISAADLYNWAADVLMPAAKLCLTDDAPRVADEKACRFCKAKGTCPALFDLTNEAIIGEFDHIQDKMSDEQMRLILDNKQLIESFIKAVDAEVMARLDVGQPFPGYKMVAGRSTRRWSAEGEAHLESALGDEAFTKKLIGITQAKKELGEKFVDENTVKTEGKPTLAKESDKRKDISLQFDVV